MIVSEKKQRISSPQTVMEAVNALMNMENVESKDQEHFYVFGLNNKNVIQYVDLISLGTVAEAIVHPREVFKLAIIRACSAIIISHNHPSGNCEPSREDISLTKRLVSGGKLLGIPVMDHVIVGEFGYYSLKEHECMDDGGDEC